VIAFCTSAATWDSSCVTRAAAAAKAPCQRRDSPLPPGFARAGRTVSRPHTGWRNGCLQLELRQSARFLSDCSAEAFPSPCAGRPDAPSCGDSGTIPCDARRDPGPFLRIASAPRHGMLPCRKKERSSLRLRLMCSNDCPSTLRSSKSAPIVYQAFASKCSKSLMLKSIRFRRSGNSRARPNSLLALPRHT
jgi:hypothetical protein